MKNILIIIGHPNSESFNGALAAAYEKGAKEAGATIKTIQIGELDFDPNLKFGYNQRMDLEPDLEQAWEKILWADHMVWVHPVWWGGIPAKMKGFIDRVFLPGRAFKYREDSVWWDKLLKGKTARIIYTADQPSWYYRIINKQPSVNSLKKMTLEFCGVKPVKTTMIGPVRGLSKEKREAHLTKIMRMGKGLK